MERGGLYGVFVLDKNSRIHFRWLRTGCELLNKDTSIRVEVKAGLAGGEIILARDDRRVHDGDLIETLEKGSVR